MKMKTNDIGFWIRQRWNNHNSLLHQENMVYITVKWKNRKNSNKLKYHFSPDAAKCDFQIIRISKIAIFHIFFRIFSHSKYKFRMGSRKNPEPMSSVFRSSVSFLPIFRPKFQLKSLLVSDFFSLNEITTHFRMRFRCLDFRRSFSRVFFVEINLRSR